jgi:hypothetical protein
MGGVDRQLTTATDADGRLRDVFLRMAKRGSARAGMVDALSGAVSTRLRSGVPLAEPGTTLVTVTVLGYAPAVAKPAHSHRRGPAWSRDNLSELRAVRVSHDSRFRKL